jgi:crotonobetaine/carnitine-CoA ligase
MTATARSVVALLRDSCERWPDRPVIAFEDGLEVTRRELRALVEAFAATLPERIRPGERVALAMENRLEFLVAFLAVVANRGVVVPLNPAAGPVDAGHVLRTSGAVLAVVDAAGAPHVADRAGLPELREVIAVDGPEPHGLPAAEGAAFDLDAAAAACASEDLIAIPFTSGTTGLPKGCMIDHAWAMRATSVALTVHSYGPDDRIFYPVRFFYMDAPMAMMRALACGGTFVAARAFSVSRFWDVVRSQRVTILSTIASMPAWLLKAPPQPDDREHAVRFAIQAHIAPELHEAMDERWGFPWLENYGMTEAGLIARVPVELADRVRGTGSAGPPAPGVQVRIVDEDGADARTGATGEILVRQPGMFRGYLGRPDATDELFHEGWIRTGDLGTLDADGFLSVVGRKKDMIRRGGENISAAEVEAVLASHPRVLEAAVLGVPDVERGEEVKAFIQLVDGAEPGDAPPAELVRFCAERLAPHKAPRFVAYIDDLPRTATLRVRKQLLRDDGAVAWDAAGEAR